MRSLPWRQLKLACVAMLEREQNGGCWVGGKIPEIMYEIMLEYYPLLEDDPQWLMVIEAVVKQNAVNAIGKTNYLRPLQR